MAVAWLAFLRPCAGVAAAVRLVADRARSHNRLPAE